MTVEHFRFVIYDDQKIFTLVLLVKTEFFSKLMTVKNGM